MQKAVNEFVLVHRLSCGAQARYIDLTSEVGELGKEILKGSDYGRTACRSSKNMEEELGDCLFSLLALACELNIDAQQALNRVLEKYETRFSEKGNISSGR